MKHINEKNITQINTEMGKIPEGWENPFLVDVFNFLSNSSFTRDQLNYDEENDIYYIHYGDIHATFKNQILDFNKEKTIPKLNQDLILSKTNDFLKNGDVIIADASEDYEGVGEAIEILNLNEKKAISGLHTFALRDKLNYTAEGFRSYIFKNSHVKKSLKTVATGSKVYGISKKNISKIKLLLPPLPEQQKIAQILATWDSAIEKQEQLISQKNRFKKGLMQQLLSAKLRFPGFDEKWKEVRLGEMFKHIKGTGLSKKRLTKNGKYGCILYGELFTIYKVVISDVISRTNDEVGVISFYGDLVLPTSTTTFGIDLANISSLLIDNVRIGGDIIILRSVKNIDSIFYAYYLSNSKKYEIAKFSQGITIIHLQFNHLKNIYIENPNIKEQQKIAALLTYIDKQIEVLQEQLKAMKNQKKGLMQVLLTGKIRVNV